MIKIGILSWQYMHFQTFGSIIIIDNYTRREALAIGFKTIITLIIIL